jgi:hypothetical protein
MGVRLKNCKIVFLKRNTMEIQVYIRKFLLDAFRKKVTEEDLNFMKSYSR